MSQESCNKNQGIPPNSEQSQSVHATRLRHDQPTTAELQEKLRDAAEHYQRAVAADDVSRQRAAVSSSMLALMNHARDQGVATRLMQPLSDLLGAVQDVESGAGNPLLQSHRPRGGQPTPSKRLRLAAEASAAVTLFMDAGLSENEALVKVAQALDAARINPAFKPRAHYPPGTWETLAKLRKDVMGCVRGQTAYRLYEQRLAAARRRTYWDARTRAKNFLKVLVMTHGRKITVDRHPK
jgi:hypothetical protein